MNFTHHFCSSKLRFPGCLVVISLMLTMLTFGGCVLKDEIYPLLTRVDRALSIFARNRASLLLMQGYNQLIISDEGGSQTFTQILSDQDGNRVRLFAGAPEGPFLLLESPEWSNSENDTPLALFVPGELPVTGWKVLYQPYTGAEEGFGERTFTEPSELRVIKTESIPDGIKLWLRCIDPEQSNDTLRLLMPVRFYAVPTPE